MGLIFHSFDKAGLGVDPNTPQKRSFFRFFEIFFRKISYFSKACLLYNVTLIPTFIIIFLLLSPISGVIMSGLSSIAADDTGAAIMYLAVCICITNLFIALWGSGPATAGMTQIMQTFAKEEHAWIIGDFKDAFKSNFKQSIAVFIIDIAITVIFYVAIAVYSQLSGFLSIFKYLIYMMIIAYTMMHLYIYPIMVTYKVSLKDLYKNAFVLAFAYLPSSLLIIAAIAAVHIGLPVLVVLFGGRYGLMLLFIVLILELIITRAFSAFILSFNAHSKFNR